MTPPRAIENETTRSPYFRQMVVHLKKQKTAVAFMKEIYVENFRVKLKLQRMRAQLFSNFVGWSQNENFIRFVLVFSETGKSSTGSTWSEIGTPFPKLLSIFLFMHTIHVFIGDETSAFSRFRENFGKFVPLCPKLLTRACHFLWNWSKRSHTGKAFPKEKQNIFLTMCWMPGSV